jgi:hypothetical protein
MNNLVATLFHIPMGFGSLFLIANSHDLSVNSITTLSIFIISLVYFLVDLYLMIKNYTSRNIIYFVHHLIGILAIICCYFLVPDYSDYIICYMTYEISTPVYNLTYTLHKMGYSADNLFYFLNQWIFALLFFLIRIVYGTWISGHLIYQIIMDDMYFYIIFPLVLQLLQYYWFYGIYRKFTS